MKTTISVPGEFHAPELAAGLNQREALRSYYTSLPKRFVSGKVPKTKIESLWLAEIFGQVSHRVPQVETALPLRNWNRPLFRTKQRLFDWMVARSLPPAQENEILVGFSGSMLKSIESGKEKGYITVVERASAHIREQQKILDRVYNNHETDRAPPISDNFARVEEKEYRKSDYIVVPSRFVRDSFEKHGVKSDKIITIPLGVSIDGPTNQTKQKRRPERVKKVVGDSPYVVFIGGARLRKGTHHLIKAWENAEIESHDLVIIGTVEDILRQELEKTGEDVHVLGWEDRIDIWYANADLFAFPSLEDGFGRVVLESLSYGTPVITTENTGAKDCIREGKDGLVIPAGCVDSLSSSIKLGISKEWDRRDIIDHVSSNYSWEAYNERVASEYQGMVKEME
ncbi:glycosyltransferase family 4 protein (plasmid) [Halarchaeum sp. CBA1220]|uniref:glycosyltransferase family 4 protein n=1 Tax=Halarchaeum sp. CBA1220 TaxID=1853682 RepID=UPI0013150208|nr:glycosyltransferase family 4 protein [Halarchaeum sp. CBA1220]QLC35110.1 glycosyltransferase family 4 protein [Halarchaeum sp. CBA1220]